MSSADGIDWTSAGPLAAAFIAGGFSFYKEWIVTGKAFNREREERRTQAKQLETLQASFQDDFLPVYRDSVEALKKLTPLLDTAVRNVGDGGGG